MAEVKRLSLEQAFQQVFDLSEKDGNGQRLINAAIALLQSKAGQDVNPDLLKGIFVDANKLPDFEALTNQAAPGPQKPVRFGSAQDVLKSRLEQTAPKPDTSKPRPGQ